MRCPSQNLMGTIILKLKSVLLFLKVSSMVYETIHLTWKMIRFINTSKLSKDEFCNSCSNVGLVYFNVISVISILDGHSMLNDEHSKRATGKHSWLPPPSWNETDLQIKYLGSSQIKFSCRVSQKSVKRVVMTAEPTDSQAKTQTSDLIRFHFTW